MLYFLSQAYEQLDDFFKPHLSFPFYKVNSGMTLIFVENYILSLELKDKESCFIVLILFTVFQYLDFKQHINVDFVVFSVFGIFGG